MQVTVDPFFDYASRHSLALFPLFAHSKMPAGKWKTIASYDPAQWQAWRDEGYMLGISAFASRVVLVDVDVKVGREAAFQYFAEWCRSLGVATPAPYCQSRSGGWHFAFRCPEGFDADANRGVISIPVSRFRALAEGEKDSEVISIRNRGYCVAPGSTFNGGQYQLFPDAPAPHEWPAALGALLSVPDIVVPNGNGTSAIGSVDPDLVRVVIEWMRDNDCIVTDDDWRELGMVLRGEYGDDVGLELFSVARNGEPIDSKGMTRWNSFNLPHQVTSRDSKIGSLIKKAKAAGCPYKFPPPPPRSATDMFGSVAGQVAQLAAAAGATLSSAETAMPLMDTQRIVAALGQPILDNFLAGTNDSPTFPMGSDFPNLSDNMANHPLYEQMRSSIARIVAMAESGKAFRQTRVLPALAVLYAMHPEVCEHLTQRIAALGGVLSPGALDSAVKNFEWKIRVETNTAAGFILDSRGNPAPENSDNVHVFVRQRAIKLRYNTWKEQVEVSDADRDAWTQLNDHLFGDLLMDAENSQFNYHPSEGRMRRGLISNARRTMYDPVRERIDALGDTWDGVPRLDTWLSQTVGVPNDTYHVAVGRNLIGGLVRRARHPGCKQAETVIFISPTQGTGKSTLCETLALEPSWYTDSFKFGGSQQNSIPQLAGKWVVELGELAGMNKTEVEDVKQFLSSTSDNFTKKYEAFATDHPRRCVFIGTSNDRRPLADATGNRRFLPVHVVGEVNIEWLRANVSQIIGEAAQREAAGESFGIPREAWDIATAHQEAARHMTPVEEYCYDWFDRGGAGGLYITSEDLKRALKMVGQTARYGGFMDKLNYRSENLTVPGLGRKCRVWVRHVNNRLDECMRLIPSQTQVNGTVDMRLAGAVSVNLPTPPLPSQPPMPGAIPPPPY